MPTRSYIKNVRCDNIADHRLALCCRIVNVSVNLHVELLDSARRTVH